MPLFWTVWAGVAVSVLLLASYIEVHGGRKGFQGANGIFVFASGYVTLLTSPVLFIVTWIGRDFLTAVIVWAIAAAAYAALFAAMLHVMGWLARRSS